MISRMNNLSIRNKLRVFTLSNSFMVTVFLLATVWVGAILAVNQDVMREAQHAFAQFNNAEYTRLEQNMQAGKDVAALPQLPGILATGNATALCSWGTGMLGHSGLSPGHRIPGESSGKLDLIALLTPGDKPLGIIAKGGNPCSSGEGQSAFPKPKVAIKDAFAPELTNWEFHDPHEDRMYEIIQVPVMDSTGKYAGRLVVGFQVSDQLAERIVGHADHEMDGHDSHGSQPAMQVALWHMDADNPTPHILGLSGKDVSQPVDLPFVTSVFAKNHERPDLKPPVPFFVNRFGFLTEPFGKPSSSSMVSSNPEHLRITVIQNTRPLVAVFNKLEWFMVLLAALAMLLGYFFGSFFSRPIATPLVSLASAAESVADGNLDHANSMLSNNKRAEATDEIGVLERSFMRMVRGLKERLAMSTFLSQATYQHICSDALDGAGANVAVRTSLAVMFSDIRKFTNFSETESPETVIALLNEVLSIQAKIVERHGGDINKFIGDAVFAWFAGDDRCKRAIAASTEIIDALKARFAGRPGTQVGVGIHLGELVVGSVGSQDRKDYTAIGSVVNKAARLCSHAKEGQVLVSAEAAAELNDPAALTALEPIMLKGIAEPVHIFEAKRSH
jgi:class 3 adenylate cyclase